MKLNLVGLATRPGVALGVSKIGPLPDDPVIWARRDLGEPPPARIEIVDESEILLAGWPALVLSARVGGADPSAPAARKLIVMFLILEYCAVVRMRCAESAFAAEKAALLAVLDSAVVDWEDQLLSLAGIWEGIS